MKLSKLGSALVATSLLLGATQAQAGAVLNSVLVGNQINTLQDSDAERVLRGGVSQTFGAFAVGDVIQSAVRFDTVNGTLVPNAFSSFTYQVTAIIELKIAAIIDTGIASGTGFGNLQQLVFTTTGNLGTNVFANLYERTDTSAGTNVNFSDTAAATLSHIGAQTLIASLGLGEADDFWTSLVINDIGTISTAISGSSQAASGTYGLTVLANPGAINIKTNGIISGTDGKLHDVVGSTSIFTCETGVNCRPGEWIASSNADARFFVVPEPSDISLMGLGLLGMGAVLRKRKSS